MLFPINTGRVKQQTPDKVVKEVLKQFSFINLFICNQNINPKQSLDG